MDIQRAATWAMILANDVVVANAEAREEVEQRLDM